MEKEIKKIAIFGGSFDPIHIGHTQIAKEALKKLDIDILIVMPAFLNPFKSNSLLCEKTRFDLVKKTFEDNKNIIVSDFEIKHQRPVYTVETVEYLQELYAPKKIYLIIGADNLKKLEQWHEYEKLCKSVEFVIASRSGYDTKLKHLDVDIDISSTDLRKKLDLDYIPEKIRNEVREIWKKD